MCKKYGTCSYYSHDKCAKIYTKNCEGKVAFLRNMSHFSILKKGKDNSKRSVNEGDTCKLDKATHVRGYLCENITKKK